MQSLCLETPGDVQEKKRRAVGKRPSGGAFQWDSLPALPAEGVKRHRTTLVPAWPGLLSAARPGSRLLRSLCGCYWPSQVERRVHAGCHLGMDYGELQAGGG